MVLAASDFFPVRFNMKRAVAFSLLFPPRSMNFLASTLTKARLFEAGVVVNTPTFTFWTSPQKKFEPN